MTDNTSANFLTVIGVSIATSVPDCGEAEPSRGAERPPPPRCAGGGAPLRRKNACALEFGRHITWPNGPRAPALLQVVAAETKTEEDYIAEIPVEISRWLHHYRTRLAPMVTGREPHYLFVTSAGAPKHHTTTALLLERTLAKRLGIKMTIHQFRHVAAKLMLDANPGAYETARQLLGHAGTRNLVRFYGGADTRRASHHHAALIERLRDDTAPNTPRRRSRRKRG